MDTKYVQYDIVKVQHQAFNDGTPSFRKTIVDIGCAVFDNIHIWNNIKSNEECTLRDNTINDLRNQIQTLISQREQCIQTHVAAKDVEIDSLKRRLCDTNDTYDKRLKDEQSYYIKKMDHINNEMHSFLQSNLLPKQNEIDFLKKTLEDLDQQRQDEIRRLEENNARYVDSLKEQLTHLKTIYDEEHKQHERNKNVVKLGQIGEAHVEQYINDHFHEGSVDNTTKKGGQGDLHFWYKQCDILIEVKNKNNITPEDVNKFTRDVKTSNTAIGGILVSIKHGVHIPCHSSYDVEWIDDTPVIFISDFETLPDMLYVAVKTIYHHHNVRKINQEKDQEDALKEELDKLINTIKQLKPIIDDAVVNLKRSTDSILRLSAIIKQELANYITKEDDRGCIMASILRKCKEHKDIYDKLPSYDELVKLYSVSRKHISVSGGMNRIKDEFNITFS
jgi:hypothetical protein